MTSLDIFCFNPIKINKIMKIEDKKIFCGPSKILKNILLSPQKPSGSPPTHLMYGPLLDYAYFKDNYRLIPVDLSQQKDSDVDPKAIQ